MNFKNGLLSLIALTCFASAWSLRSHPLGELGEPFSQNPESFPSATALPTQPVVKENLKTETLPLPLPQDLQELNQIQKELHEIYQKSGFDYKHMTKKEYEDSIALLREYNKKIKALIKESQHEASL